VPLLSLWIVVPSRRPAPAAVTTPVSERMP